MSESSNVAEMLLVYSVTPQNVSTKHKGLLMDSETAECEFKVGKLKQLLPT